jgi:hypothetical protein
MHLFRNQVVFVPKGGVVQRAGSGEDLVLADSATGVNLHNQEVFVLSDGSVRSRNGLYVRLERSVTTINSLVIEAGETVFVRPFVAVQIMALSKQTTEKWPADPTWDAIAGASLVAGSAVFVGFAFRR